MPKSLMLIEDEMLIAFDMQNMLENAGYEVIGPFSSANEATSALQKKVPDMALLDVNLGDGKTSFTIAKALNDANVPYAFVSGYAVNADKFHSPFDERPRLGKPCTNEDLLKMVDALLVAAD